MTPRRIAVAVVVHEGRVLVGRRADDAVEHPGRAEFPGGKIDSHETSSGAALRECREETGIVVRALGRTLEVAATNGGPPITFHWATPVDPGAPPRPPFAWLPISELPRLNFPPANARVVEMLVRDHPAEDHGGS